MLLWSERAVRESREPLVCPVQDTDRQVKRKEEDAVKLSEKMSHMEGVMKELEDR